VVVLCEGDMWFGRLGFVDTLDVPDRRRSD